MSMKHCLDMMYMLYLQDFPVRPVHRFLCRRKGSTFASHSEASFVF